MSKNIVTTRDVHMASLSPLIEEVLKSGGRVELTVTGNSMWPMLLHKVSRVRLAPISTLKRGDIPLYRRENGAFVLHRITAVDGNTYTCCGDNQWHQEYGLWSEQMIAVVTEFCRKGRWVSVENRSYQMYWRVWLLIRPIRRLFFGGWRRVKMLIKRISVNNM